MLAARARGLAVDAEVRGGVLPELHLMYTRNGLDGSARVYREHVIGEQLGSRASEREGERRLALKLGGEEGDSAGAGGHRASVKAEVPGRVHRDREHTPG